MAMARKLSAALELTPYFHCTSRCVRGSYLCGLDRNTGNDYTHRRKWLRERLIKLADCFSIKLAAFTIMENHFHVVLRVQREVAESWTETEVVNRWHTLFKGTPQSQKFVRSETLTQHEKKQLSMSIERWRNALFDISWFMRCAKEPLARSANREDGCKGRFWEGRFHSQALLDISAVIACMSYVDLNPVRARMCTLPETDPYTSFNYRTRLLTGTFDEHASSIKALLPLNVQHLDTSRFGSPIGLREYIALVDATARHSRSDKKANLCSSVQPILKRLGLHGKAWTSLESTFTDKFHVLVGSKETLRQACKVLGQKRAWGQRACHEFFNASDST